MTARSPIGTRRRQLISRASFLNETRPFTRQRSTADGSVIRNTNISFTSPNTITSASSQFGNLIAGQIISIVGSPLNNSTWLIETASASTLTVSPSQIKTESAGADISIWVV